MKNIFKLLATVMLMMFIAHSCKKLDRPQLGDYPKDANPPGGPLKFYVAFNGTTSNPLMNAVDSIRANFPSSNPLTQIDGIKGKAVQGGDQKAINYPSANDFGKSATSFTIAFWIKNTVPTGGNPQFAFSLADKDFWANSAMFLLFDHTGAGATTDSAIVKFYINDNKGDHWFELVGNDRIYRIYDQNWHHLAFSYDETTSNMKVYRDGQLIKTLNWSGHGKFEVTPSSVGNFVIGGMNKHVGLEGPADPWIQSWLGGLDQFRLYGKVLTDSEIMALFNSKM